MGIKLIKNGLLVMVYNPYTMANAQAISLGHKDYTHFLELSKLDQFT